MNSSPLQIAHAPTDLPILGVTRRLPKGPSYIVIEGDQSRDPVHAAAEQVLLPRPRQRDPDALTPMLLRYCEPVHVPPPPIPRSDQSTNDLAAALGNQERGRGMLDEPLNVLQAVGRARVLAPLLLPKVKHRLRIPGSTPTDRDPVSASAQSSGSPTSTSLSRSTF
jgi:hypothetical protein